jgi:hypothetical protein
VCIMVVELVDAVLGINKAEGFDFNVNLHLVHFDDVFSRRILKRQRYASLLSNFLLDNLFHFGVN